MRTRCKLSDWMRFGKEIFRRSRASLALYEMFAFFAERDVLQVGSGGVVALERGASGVHYPMIFFFK